MFSWLRRSAAPPQPDPVDPSSHASPPLDPSPSSSPSTAVAQSSTAPATSSPTPPASAPAAAEDARTARNRKKRQQKKKSALRHKRHSASFAAPGTGTGTGTGSEAGDDDDEREPDDDDVGAPAPEADDDLSYLERIGGLKRQREDKARELAAAAAVAGGGSGAAPGSAAAGGGAGGAAGAAGFGGAASSPTGSSGAGGAGAGVGAPLRDAFALPGEAPLDTRGVTAGPEQIEAAQLVGEMLRQGKIRPGATGPLNRISGLPDGAGQVNGLDIPSTHELRKTAKENGLVPFTDDRGMLRIGVRVAPDVVLMHPKDGKGEPILLRM